MYDRVLKWILNTMAAICLVFDVDWDEEFLDDEYVIECRRSEIHEVQV